MIDNHIDSKKNRFLAVYGSNEHVRELIGRNSNIDEAIAKNPSIQREFSEKLLNSNNVIVQCQLAENTPHLDHLDKLSRSDDPLIRNGIFFNHNATSAHIQNAMDKNSGLKDNAYDHYTVQYSGSIARHPNASKEQLESVAKDPSAYQHHRGQAQKRIDTGDYK